MLKRINPTTTKTWQSLLQHLEKMKTTHMRDLFTQDPARFQKLSLRFNDILLDYSKNRITEETIGLLIELVKEVDLTDAIEKMFGGDKINESENRAVLGGAESPGAVVIAQNLGGVTFR